jgi:hypothetical protein
MAITGNFALLSTNTQLTKGLLCKKGMYLELVKTKGQF